MSRRHIPRTNLNGEEQSSSSFRIPDPTNIFSTVNTTTHTGFAPINNSIPPVFGILNNRDTFSIINGTNNCASNNSNNDNRNFFFPTDRFNLPLLPSNITPHANMINNDPRIQAILSSSLRQHNSVGVNVNGTAFDRFLQPFSAPQGASVINPPSIPMINVASVTPSIPAAGHTSNIPSIPVAGFSMATASNPGPSLSPFIPPSLLNDQSPYNYLLSFEEQTKIAHKAAMHYANLTECLMEHARNAAAAENMPLPPLPQAVLSMVQKYDQKESLQKQQKKEDEKKDPQATPDNTVPLSLSDTIINRDTSSQQQISSGLLGRKRLSSFTSAFSEPLTKGRHIDNASNTDTTPSRSESDSSNKTAPILSPHPYHATPAENNFEQQQNEMEMNESRRKSTAETIVEQSLRMMQERFSERDTKYETKTNHSSNVLHSMFTPSERFTLETTSLTLENTSKNASELASTSSQPHLDSGISMSLNSTDKQEQISHSKPSSSTLFTENSVLVKNKERNDIDVINYVMEPTIMLSNQTRVTNPQMITKLPTMPPSNALGYPFPQQPMQNSINQMMQTPGPSTSAIGGPFKGLPGYTITTNGILITPDGRAIPPAVYNCFGVPGEPITSMNSDQDDDNLCAICGDKSSGNHYSVPSCEGCKGFFRRTIQKKIEYICYKQGNCVVDQKNRNRCQCCRFKKCLQLGMRQESVRLDRNRRRKKDESREKELEEIEEMKKLKATVVSAYREAFPEGKIISNREEAVERIHVFLNDIPIMKEIKGKDREKVVENGIYAALTLRTFFTTENYESIVGVGRETLAQCLNGLGFDVTEEEMAILTAFCSLQNCMGMIGSEKIQNIGAKLCNCLRVHLTSFCDGVNEIICKCIMTVTALMLMQGST